MSDISPSWLQREPPWQAPVPASLCANLPIRPGDVPVVEVLGNPCTLAEVVALRAGRFVPLYGLGATEAEGHRALALLGRAFGPNADPRGAEHAATMAVHPVLGAAPWEGLARALTGGQVPPWVGEVALGFVGVLGAGDSVRAQVAEALSTVPALASEAVVARAVGGGAYGTWREHYQALRSAEGTAPVLGVARQWFDFVLARRWSGVDALRGMADDPGLEVTARWLAASGLWLGGDEASRNRLTELAQGVLDPLHPRMPRLSALVARELAELLAHPWAMRWDHLRAAAARDHAAAAIRAWLHAATEVEAEDVGMDAGALGPEPSRAGRAAVESRQVAGEFLLDWFVPEREARVAVDDWAARTLRTWHRLRGAALIARAERAAGRG